MTKRLLPLFVLSFALLGLAACEDPCEDPCSLSCPASEDNLTDDERREMCGDPALEPDPYATTPVVYASAPSNEPKPGSPEESFQIAHDLEEQAARDQDDLDKKENLLKAIELYRDALPGVPAGIKDLARAANAMLELEPVHPTVQTILLEVWDGGRDTEELRPVLAGIRDRHVAAARESGFNLDKRYRRKDMDPYKTDVFCDGDWALDTHITAIVEISTRLDPETAETKRWRLHAADAMVTSHVCEGTGTGINPDNLHTAYVDYQELGHNADALAVAEQAAELHLGIFVSGDFSDGCACNIADPGDEASWEEAKDWLEDLPEAKRREMINDAAEWAERESRPEVALRLYQEIGDTPNAKRMAALATDPDSESY